MAQVTIISFCKNLLIPSYHVQGNNRNKKEKSGISLVDLAYRRAKAAKGAKKAADAGKAVRTNRKGAKKPSSHSSKSRPDEMKDLFQSDMNEKKQKRSSGVKKSSSFKSKSRYLHYYKRINNNPLFSPSIIFQWTVEISISYVSSIHGSRLFLFLFLS